MPAVSNAMSLLPLIRTKIPGPCSRRLGRLLARVESRNFPHNTIFWERASGANVWDVDGNRYVDLTAGFGVAAVGHTNPRVQAAVRAQAARLLHGLGDVQPHRLRAELAAELVRLTFGQWDGSAARVVFGSSGSEAVEIALKTAALHTRRPGVIAFGGGYHGLSYGALAVTAWTHFRSPFARQLGRFVRHARFGELPHAAHDVGAVLVEPIQGRAGIRLPPADFLTRLRRFCDRHRLVLIFDEIYTGLCRTGRWFACEHWGVVPDIITVGKALGGGLPISACIGRASVMDSWPASTGEALHTSTFLGNPIACAAALATLAEMKRLRLDQRAAMLGDWVSRRLPVRGCGLFLGIEVGNALPLTKKLLARGIIAIAEGEHSETLAILPPLTITRRQLDFCLRTIAELTGQG